MNRPALAKQFCKKVGWCYCLSSFKKHALVRHDYIPNLAPVVRELCVFGDSRVAGAAAYQGGFEGALDLAVPAHTDGIGGTSTKQWARQEAVSWIMHKNPAYAMIALGGNDLGGGMSDQEFLGNIFQIVCDLRENTAIQPIVHDILPLIQHMKATNADVIRVNNRLAILCRILGVPFIQNFGFFNVPGIQTYNGLVFKNVMNLNCLALEEIPFPMWGKGGHYPVHLNAAGYKEWYFLLNIGLKKVVI
jgi:lysophospholipase L1-like esterase